MENFWKTKQLSLW